MHLNITTRLLADVPLTTAETPPGMDLLTHVIGWFFWGLSIACLIGLGKVGYGLALQHERRDEGDHGKHLGMVIGAMILGVAAGPIVNFLLFHK